MMRREVANRGSNAAQINVKNGRPLSLYELTFCRILEEFIRFSTARKGALSSPASFGATVKGIYRKKVLYYPIYLDTLLTLMPNLSERI